LLFNTLKIGVLVIVLFELFSLKSIPFFGGNVELFVKRAQEERTANQV
jgi:hypothetical protein